MAIQTATNRVRPAVPDESPLIVRFPTERDLALNPLRIGLEAVGVSGTAGSAWLNVTLRDAAGSVLAYNTVLVSLDVPDVDKRVVLRTWEQSCDRDRDGVAACPSAKCCDPGVTVTDCDEKRDDVHPFRIERESECGDDVDQDCRGDDRACDAPEPADVVSSDDGGAEPADGVSDPGDIDGDISDAPGDGASAGDDALPPNDADIGGAVDDGSGEDVPPLLKWKEPCVEHEECESGLCAADMEGRRCAFECSEDIAASTGCGRGWRCVRQEEGPLDGRWACLPVTAQLCRPCQDDVDCLGPDGDVGARCLSYGPIVRYCGADCSASPIVCPADYECEATGDGGAKQCVNSQGGCLCTQRHVDEDAKTGCSRPPTQHAPGTCTGEGICLEIGHSVRCEITAPVEACNRLDDDCDNVIDEDWDPHPQRVDFPCEPPEGPCFLAEFGCLSVDSFGCVPRGQAKDVGSSCSTECVRGTDALPGDDETIRHRGRCQQGGACDESTAHDTLVTCPNNGPCTRGVCIDDIEGVVPSCGVEELLGCTP